MFSTKHDNRFIRNQEIFINITRFDWRQPKEDKWVNNLRKKGVDGIKLSNLDAKGFNSNKFSEKGDYRSSSNVRSYSNILKKNTCNLNLTWKY